MLVKKSFIHLTSENRKKRELKRKKIFIPEFVVLDAADVVQTVVVACDTLLLSERIRFILLVIIVFKRSFVS